MELNFAHFTQALWLKDIWFWVWKLLLLCPSFLSVVLLQVVSEILEFSFYRYSLSYDPEEEKSKWKCKQNILGLTCPGSDSATFTKGQVLPFDLSQDKLSSYSFDGFCDSDASFVWHFIIRVFPHGLFHLVSQGNWKWEDGWLFSSKRKPVFRRIKPNLDFQNSGPLFPYHCSLGSYRNRFSPPSLLSLPCGKA